MTIEPIVLIWRAHPPGWPFCSLYPWNNGRMEKWKIEKIPNLKDSKHPCGI
jgi:hypothetical protein